MQVFWSAIDYIVYMIESNGGKKNPVILVAAIVNFWNSMFGPAKTLLLRKNCILKIPYDVNSKFLDILKF